VSQELNSGKRTVAKHIQDDKIKLELGELALRLDGHYGTYTGEEVDDVSLHQYGAWKDKENTLGAALWMFSYLEKYLVEGFAEEQFNVSMMDSKADSDGNIMITVSVNWSFTNNAPEKHLEIKAGSLTGEKALFFEEKLPVFLGTNTILKGSREGLADVAWFESRLQKAFQNVLGAYIFFDLPVYNFDEVKFVLPKSRLDYSKRYGLPIDFQEMMKRNQLRLIVKLDGQEIQVPVIEDFNIWFYYNKTHTFSIKKTQIGDSKLTSQLAWSHLAVFE